MQTEPGGILALDTGTLTGYAYGTDHRFVPTWGVIKTAGMTDLGKSFVGLDNELTGLIQFLQPRKVVYEAALVFKDTPADPRLPMLLIGLAAHVHSACYRENVECEHLAASRVRSLVIGKGTFAKPFHGEGKVRTPRAGGEPRLMGDAKEEVLLWHRRVGWESVTEPNARDAAILVRYELMYGSGARVMAGAGAR